MKKASWFEIIAARCWNLLNEGKPFTPIFVTGTFLLYHAGSWDEPSFWAAAGIGFLPVLPMLAVYYLFDFPLFLRNFLWVPLLAHVIVWNRFDIGLALFALALYFFFTVFFWGTLYYHLRIGTSWLNFTRFWKLVLKNSDSTSGNAQEQIPKFLLLLSFWEGHFTQLEKSLAFNAIDWPAVFLFSGSVLAYSWVLHHTLFDWKPKEIPSYTGNVPERKSPLVERVIVIVIDGMRKDRFEEAEAPFLKSLRRQGTEYAQMETVYPARTVVCFSSMFTGTYPREHGIRSNMVWRLGVKVESIFDSLRKVNKKGCLLGIAHLIDAFGDDVESVTAVMHNDEADRNILQRARQIIMEQDPDLLVVQLIGTDQTGHSRGVLYDEYLQKISEADRLIEEFFAWLKERDRLDGTAFIICADHGQADGIGGHGHLDEGERYVPFFLYGEKIAKGKRIEGKRSIVSLAPTIAYLLGAPYPSHSRGPVLIEALQAEGDGVEAG